MDFMLAILAFGAIAAFTHPSAVGQLREHRAYASVMLVAAASGGLLAVSNVLMQQAVQLLGVALAPMLQASVVLVLCKSALPQAHAHIALPPHKNCCCHVRREALV
jgi:hypothetical protein